MATEITQKEESKLSRNAYRVYGFLALFVYVLALSYCYATDRIFEMSVIGVVVLVLGSIVGLAYKKL